MLVHDRPPAQALRSTPLGVAALLAVSLGLSSCATRALADRELAAVAAPLSVERFLQAANARDHAAMGRLFGTADGPIGDTGSTFGCTFKKIGSWFGGEPCRKREEVELRLDAIAIVLRHDDYRLTGERSVAGRRHPTTRITVNLLIDRETVTGVPFEVVRTSGGRWLVQRIDLARVTSR